MENLVVHPKSITDLTVTFTLPEEFLDKEVRITAEPLEKEKSVKEQIAADPFWQWVDSLKIDTRGWKFDRDEANER